MDNEAIKPDTFVGERRGLHLDKQVTDLHENVGALNPHPLALPPLDMNASKSPVVSTLSDGNGQIAHVQKSETPISSKAPVVSTQSDGNGQSANVQKSETPIPSKAPVVSTQSDGNGQIANVQKSETSISSKAPVVSTQSDGNGQIANVQKSETSISSKSSAVSTVSNGNGQFANVQPSETSISSKAPVGSSSPSPTHPLPLDASAQPNPSPTHPPIMDNSSDPMSIDDDFAEPDELADMDIKMKNGDAGDSASVFDRVNNDLNQLTVSVVGMEREQPPSPLIQIKTQGSAIGFDANYDRHFDQSGNVSNTINLLFDQALTSDRSLPSSAGSTTEDPTKNNVCNVHYEFENSDFFREPTSSGSIADCRKVTTCG